MNTNDKIVGVAFELDKDKYYRLLEQTGDKQLASQLAAQTAIVFKADNTKHEIIDLHAYADNAKIRKIKEVMSQAAKDGAKAEIASYFSDNLILKDCLDRAKKHKDYLTLAEVDNELKKIMKQQRIKTGATVGSIAMAIALGLAGCSILRNKDNSVEDQTAIEIQVKDQTLPEDWLSYVEEAVNNDQKQFFVNNIAEWLTSVNGQENWEKVSLTEDQMKEYSYIDSECLFGFTAEEAYSLALAFGNYTNEDYLTITGGNQMDIVAIRNSAHSISNGALAKIIAYYVNSDECNLQIEKLINFNEAEDEKNKEFEALFQEYHALDNEKGKEQAAKEKMQEIKKALVNYAQDVDFEQDNAKSYILRTFAVAASTISQMHQYQDTIEISVYDTINDENTTKEIKTDLFDEITMRTLVLGFNECEGIAAFDAESFLEEHNISKSRYNLLNTDVSESIADQSYSAQIEKLEEANTYIATMRTEDRSMEVAFAGGAGIDLNTVDVNTLNNVPSTYDAATDNTYDPTVIIDLLDGYLLNNNISPKNVDYFTKYAIAEKFIAYKDTHGATKGKPGDIIATTSTSQGAVTEQSLSATNTTVKDHAGNTTTAEKATEEARQEDAQTSPEYDYPASTPEESQKAEDQAEQSQGAKDRAALLQGVYDATYNYYAGQTVRSTNVGYDPAWAYSSDAEIVSQYNIGKADGLKWKQDEETYQNNGGQPTYGGGIVIDPGYEDAEISNQPQAPVESVDNTTPPSTDNGAVVVPPEETQPEQPSNSGDSNNQNQSDDGINYLPGFDENTEYEGGIIIGDPTNASGSISDSNINYFSGSENAEIVGDIIIGNEPSSTTVDSNNVENYIDNIDSVISNMSDEEWEALISDGSITYDEVSQKTR